MVLVSKSVISKLPFDCDMENLILSTENITLSEISDVSGYEILFAELLSNVRCRFEYGQLKVEEAIRLSGKARIPLARVVKVVRKLLLLAFFLFLIELFK